jgi:low affinity Fe/Cu permease
MVRLWSDFFFLLNKTMTVSLKAFKKAGFSAKFETIANKVTRLAGSSIAFLIAVTIILVWGITGPMFHFSDTWQLVINTSTTIVTFLMVFIIQQSQNKDAMALQLKLNELIACNEAASNRLIDVEDITQEELDVLKKFYVKLASLAKKENQLFSSHSIDEAEGIHVQKSNYSQKRVANRTKKAE